MSKLPEEFAELEPFAERWAIGGTAARAALRGAAEPEQRAAFYGAMLPRAAQALDHLDAKPLADLSEAERKLMDMLLSFAHVSIAEEIQQGDEAKHAALRQHMVITCSPADKPA